MRIGIANDLTIAVEVLRRAVSQRAENEIAWVARDGLEAVASCVADRPDVVLMDLIMPNLDGVEATRRIMKLAPCPILIVTDSVGSNSSRVYDAMGAGALDAIDTPVSTGDQMRRSTAVLLERIERIGGLAKSPAPVAPVFKTQNVARSSNAPLIAIGASAGGPTALATVLAALPADFGASVVIVQHVDRLFAAGMVEWLGRQTKLPVRIALEGDAPQPGVVLLAGTNDHMCFDAAGMLHYDVEPADLPYRPSVDVFFFSIVEHWPGRALGVLLTGMGRDGAYGLKAMREKGCYTIAQDAASSAVYGMPKAAAEIGAACAVLPLTGIASMLVRY